ncbi:MAG: hypothetical protein ACOC7X_01945 [Spirochaetota bacterium]
MAEQFGRSASALLHDFIETVLEERQVGRIDVLCFHRVRLFTDGSRHYYSVPAVQEQVLQLFSAFPDIHFEVLQELTDSHTKSGAAAMLRLKTSEWERTGFVLARIARGRITTLRFVFALQGRNEQTKGIGIGNSYPAAEVEVAAVPNKVYMQYEYLQEMQNYPVLEDYMYQLAGLPRAEQGTEVECSQDLQVCLQPGSVYLADVMGERTASGQHVYLLVWYKGLLLEQGNVTTSGASYVELNEQGVLRDIRVFDEIN